MNRMMAKASVLAIFLIASLPLGLAAQDEGYYSYSYARLSYVNGAVYVQRTADLGYEKGEVNLALVQGDLLGTESGQAEIHFGRRNYLRLGDNTKVEFVMLPREGEDRINLHMTAGRAYLRVSALAVDKGIEIHTPDASFYVLDEGLYRFDVRPGGETQAFVLEGSLETAVEDGSVLVRGQETVMAAEGRLLGDPAYGGVPGDDFDDWNGSRDTQLAVRSERQYLPSDIDEYEEELDQNGSWVYERPYGNVWVPNVSGYVDWRPYFHGRWVWYPGCGWTWIPAEPWGWTVYHYGRWNWRFGLGWYWIPRSHWGPAWVHWWSDGLYVGWCPLTWYNRPAYLFHDRFYDRWDDRFLSAHNRAMTVIRRDHLQSPDVGRRHLGSSDLDRIGRVELRDRQPAIRPAVDNARPQALAARRALADPSGGRSRVREVAPSRALSSPHSRPGSAAAPVRSVERGGAGTAGGHDALVRPSIRGGGAGDAAVRTFPSRRDAGSSGVTEHRRGAAVSPDRSGASVRREADGRADRSQVRDPGGSRASTVREPQQARSSGSGGGGAVSRGGSAVKSNPPAARTGSGIKSSSGRSQSRSYPSSSSITRPSARVSGSTAPSSRSTPSITRPSAAGRSSSRSSSSRYSASSSRSTGVSASRRPNSGSSSIRPGASSRSSVAPRSSGGSSGRSVSAPRSTRPSPGRSVAAPRASGSASVRSARARSSSSSGRSGSSGRSRSSASRSSSSSSRSGRVKK
jgi:hypothetical protein